MTTIRMHTRAAPMLVITLVSVTLFLVIVYERMVRSYVIVGDVRARYGLFYLHHPRTLPSVTPANPAIPQSDARVRENPAKPTIPESMVNPAMIESPGNHTIPTNKANPESPENLPNPAMHESRGYRTISKNPGKPEKQANPAVPEKRANPSRPQNSSRPGPGFGSNFIRHTFTGRLGNVLFQYASIYCLAKRNGLTPVFSNNVPELQFLQHPPALYKASGAKLAPSLRYREEACCSMDRRLTTLDPSRNYSIGGYLQSWRYFQSCKADVLRLVTFKDQYVARANRSVQELRRRYPGRTLVGVHVRLEDYTRTRAVSNGKTTASPDYFLRVIAFFRERYPRVVFVVLTSSPAWWMTRVNVTSGVTFLPRSHPAVDLEVLSSLDHVAVSVGTFGWWAAYRCAGTVLCYGRFFTPGSRYGKQFWHNATDYIYPGWIRL